MSVLLASLPVHVLAACSGGSNPFCGVTPNLNFLGSTFNLAWAKWLGGAMGVALIVLAFFLVQAIVGLRHAKNMKKPQEAEHAKGVLIGVSIAIGALILLPTIFGAILIAANQS